MAWLTQSPRITGLSLAAVHTYEVAQAVQFCEIIITDNDSGTYKKDQ